MRKLLVAIVLVTAIVGGIVLVSNERPKLDHARDAADTAWKPLVLPLTARYTKLAELDAQVTAALAANGVENGDFAALKLAIFRWRRALRQDPDAQVTAANDLEARAARARALLGASARLTRAPQVNATIAAFDQAAPPAAAVTAYNDAVLRYQRARESAVRRVIARLFGYDERPTFEPPAPNA